MNLREFVELTALTSAHSPLLLSRRTPIAREPLAALWSALRKGAKLQGRRLERLTAEADVADDQRREQIFRRMQPLMIDVFAGDLATRTWGAITTAAERESGEAWGGDLVLNAAAHQRAARHMALRALTARADWPVDPLIAVDRMRRRLERWTDVLVGHLVRRYSLPEFAFDAVRASDFGSEQMSERPIAADGRVWDLYLLSLRCSMPALSLPGGRLGRLREEQVRAMLACFGSEQFDSTGNFLTPVLSRVLSGGVLPGMPPARRVSASRRTVL